MAYRSGKERNPVMKHLAPLSLSSGPSLRRFLGVAAVTTLASAAAAGTVGSVAWASAAARPAAAVSYSFRTLNNHHDLTFNQLLGINNEGLIAGYFGSGAKGHPNKGYRLSKPYSQGNYASENYPGSRQTQVTGLNDTGTTVGFWSTQNKASLANNNFGFYLPRRPLPRGQLPGPGHLEPAGRPAPRRERQQRRGRVLRQRPGRQPRLHVQHQDRPLRPRRCCPASTTWARAPA